MKLTKKKISLEMEFFEGKQDVVNGIFEGGVKDPQFLEELTFDILEGESFDFEKDEFIKNGKYEIHLKGSNNALRELGKYLLTLSYYETKDPSYHDHFDNLLDSKGNESIDLVIYKNTPGKNK